MILLFNPRYNCACYIVLLAKAPKHLKDTFSSCSCFSRPCMRLHAWGQLLHTISYLNIICAGLLCTVCNVINLFLVIRVSVYSVNMLHEAWKDSLMQQFVIKCCGNDICNLVNTCLVFQFVAVSILSHPLCLLSLLLARMWFRYKFTHRESK